MTDNENAVATDATPDTAARDAAEIADRNAPQEDVDALLDDLFTYHAATPEQAAGYQRINDAAKVLARVIHEVCPQSPDRSAAMRKVREARMTANSSIATKSGGRYW